MVRSKAHPQGESERRSEKSSPTLLAGYLKLCAHYRELLSPRDRFGMQDETFNAVEFLLSHPVFTSPLLSRIATCSSLSDVYLHTGQLTLYQHSI